MLLLLAWLESISRGRFMQGSGFAGQVAASDRPPQLSLLTPVNMNGHFPQIPLGHRRAASSGPGEEEQGFLDVGRKVEEVPDLSRSGAGDSGGNNRTKEQPPVSGGIARRTRRCFGITRRSTLS